MRPSVRAPEPLTPEAKLRYADGILDAGRERIIAVQEDHSSSGEAINSIAAVCKCQSPALSPVFILLDMFCNTWAASCSRKLETLMSFRTGTVK